MTRRTLLAGAIAAPREPLMKPLWTQTLVWIAAVVAAVLLAWASPDSLGFGMDSDYPQGGMAPR